ncbi:MAG TPA: S8 family serine peptidase, partial [Actinomycetota bacterium]
MRPSRALAIGITLSLTAGALLWAPPAASTQPQPPRASSRPAFVPGELLIQFRPGTPAVERAAARARHGLTRVKGLPLPDLELVRFPGQGQPPEVAARVAADVAIRAAEPNLLWYPDGIPDDPEFEWLWGLHNEGQTGGTPDADIDAPEGWAVAADSSDVVVAVIDTGVWIDHPDLQAQIWTNPGESGGGKETNGVDDDMNGYVDDVHGWDFFNDDATVFDANQPDDHGTHVAGTIAATIDNATHVAGVSQATIMPLKFLGPQGGATSAAIEALDYAIDNGAHLTNNSWGGGGFSGMLQAKIEQANGAGVLFVAAAGNGGSDGEGDDNDATPHYPASYTNANVISVAATTDTDALAPFSNFGAVSVDLGAPGDDILSTVPRFAKAVLVGPDTGAGVAYRSAFHTFGLEGITSGAHREAILSSALDWMGVSGTDPILLVDDDRGASFLTAYANALQSLGFTNRTVHTVPTAPPGCNNGPNAAEMSEYDAVIWFTGADFSCTLTGADQTQLGTYLTGGGNLLLFGQDIGYDLIEDTGGSPPSTFLEAVLFADYVADIDFNFRPSGVAGTPYASVPTVELSTSGSDSQLFSSALEPRPGAIAGMRGAPTAWFDGTSMATPHVTGAAALVMATHPSLGHLDVKARLLGRGDPLPGLAGKTVSGKRLNLASSLAFDPPGAPAALTVSASAGGQIDLSWTASPGPGVTGYNVYRGTTSGFPPSPGNRIASLVAGTSYSDPGSNTVDGTTYYYLVRAENSQGDESGDSNEASATADHTPPEVAGTIPEDGETDVPVSTSVSVIFSEAVEPSTVGASSITLTGPGGPVAGGVSLDPSGTEATLTPAANLLLESTYTADVTSDVEDLAGNPLTPASWTFDTTAVDTEAPDVEIVGPASGEGVRAQPHTMTGTATDDVEVDNVEVAVRWDASGGTLYWDAGSADFVPGETWNQATIEPGVSSGGVTWSLDWMPPDADREPFAVLARATDTSNNITDPPEEVSFWIDNVAPAGSVSIDDDAPLTGSRSVILTLTASDGSEIEFSVANGEDPNGPWQPFAPSLSWSLSGGADGLRTVYVKFRDHAGNTTTVEDDILLDITAPTASLGPLPAFQRTTRFDVSWTGGDAGSGLDGYRVEIRKAGLKGAWTPWTEWTTTSDEVATFQGRTGRTYCFRVAATDQAGNTSSKDSECTA